MPTHLSRQACDRQLGLIVRHLARQACDRQLGLIVRQSYNRSIQIYTITFFPFFTQQSRSKGMDARTEREDNLRTELEKKNREELKDR